MTNQEIVALYPKIFSPLWKRSPLKIFFSLLIFSYLIFSINYFNISVTELFNSLSKMKPILLSMITWNDFLSWNFNSILVGILQTLAMAFLGTFAASFISIPLGLLALRQLQK